MTGLFKDKSMLQRLSVDADQAEFESVRNGVATLESGFIDDHIASNMDDFEIAGDMPEWQLKDVANDTAVGGLFEELLRRKSLMKECYPFILDGNSIEPIEAISTTYKFCLSICNVNINEYPEFPRVFERVSMEYVRRYFGDYAKALHTGWPRNEGDPKSFKGLADFLHGETQEWKWGPDHSLGDDDANHIKDCGIDFIAWLDTPDHRVGKFFFLGQCACGNNWNSKFDDIRPEKYSRWFNPATHIPPGVVFCTPFSMVDGYLYQASQECGMVFDRVRLSLLASKFENDLPDELITQMQECIDKVCN